MITAVESPLWLFLYRYSMQFGETLFPDKIISMLKDWKLNKTIQILWKVKYHHLKISLKCPSHLFGRL